MTNAAKQLGKKQAAYRFGIWAEILCIILLLTKGYAILKRRHRNHYGEIDLIARKGNSLIFIEVKARKSRADGLEAVSRTQQDRIMRAALDFVGRNSKYAGLAMRFDLMVVSKSRWPITITHMPHAFEHSPS